MEEEELNKKNELIETLMWLVIVVCVALLSSAITFKYVTTRTEKQLASATSIDLSNANGTEAADTIAATLKKFRAEIDKTFLWPIDENEMLENTIKGYIKGLGDEYSEYMTADEWKEYQESAFGDYSGIGIYMGQEKNGNLVILAPIVDTPAEKAGLKAGDIITKINDEAVTDIKLNDVTKKVKGEVGTKVKLQILRNQEYLDFEIEREEIKLYQAQSKMLENEIGYIQLFTFNENTSTEVEEAVNKLKSEGAKKIILDLRNNTGGLVDECLKVADLALNNNSKELIIKDKFGNTKENFAKRDKIIDCPIVILVNEYTASASEILTGALKDNNVAKVVGTKTYGKGVIQNVMTLNDGSALKLTVAEYYTPNEIKIHKVGITPDYEVEDVKQENAEAEIDEQLNKAIEVIKEMN